ncbi:MAG TPA: DNA polymerase III subunit beta [Nitrospirae bacterium]|nr:DNA polymerase III subunit beta [Nitrospirota bacterium]
MHIRVNKEELQSRLSNIQSIVDKKSTMPILGHFLLTVDQSSFITATDLETAIKEPLQIEEIKEGGQLCIPAKKFYEIVREMDGEIELEAEGTDWLKIRTGKSLFRIACMNPDDFPKWPQITDTKTISFSASKLQNMIEKTLYAAGESDTRYTLNSLLFHIKPDEKSFAIVGTDGHRLSLIKEPLNVEGLEETKVIVPRKSASELRRFLLKATRSRETEEEAVEAEATDTTILMHITKNHVVFKTDEIEFLVRLIEGNYPSYEQVIPVANEKKVLVQREDFIKALRRVSIISKDRSNAIKLDLETDRITLTASNPDLGDARDEIDVQYSGEAISLGFNARYLVDALNAMSADTVVFELQEPLSPTLLKEVGIENYICVVMPMRI